MDFSGLQVVLLGRITGEVGNHRVGVGQIEHRKIGLPAVWYWPLTMGFWMHISLTGILFSKTALPFRRIQAYARLDTETST